MSELTVNFTNDWPDTAIDWVGTIGFGVVLGFVGFLLIWLVIGRCRPPRLGAWAFH